jgi:hypothetical protein
MNIALEKHSHILTKDEISSSQEDDILIAKKYLATPPEAK